MVMLAGLCAEVSAAIVSSNIDKPAASKFAPGYDLATTITTDATASSTTIGWLYASATDPRNPGYGHGLVWSFYTDNAGSIGTKVAGTDMTFHSLDLNTKRMAFSSQGFTLSDNTTYWLVADASALDSIFIDVTADTSETGWAIGNSMLYRSFDSTGSWNTWNRSMQIEIQSIPEPASVAMLGLASAGIWFVRRRLMN